ncbi:MAG: FAD-dependent oxidoreductase, partial [Patescibacteria group bacterium]
MYHIFELQVIRYKLQETMRIAILGGGFAGLSAAHYLQKKNHDITLFERDTHLGGLAGGFKKEGWDWYLEKTYHHWFSNDYDILNFAKEVGFTDILFDEPLTSSFYSVQNKASFIPLDTPFDLLRFPLLSLPVKIRVGLVLAFLKVSPFFTAYERQTAEEMLEKSMGKRAWDVLWSQLFRKKFGKYAG